MLSSYGSHETCEKCANMGGGAHGNFPTGSAGGAPYRAPKRVRGAPKLAGGHIELYHWSR